MTKERRTEMIDHALNPLWSLHYDLMPDNKEDARLDARLETIIRKLYELRDIMIYGDIR